MTSLTVSALRDDGVAWNRYVEGHPEGTVEHLAEWRDHFPTTCSVRSRST